MALVIAVAGIDLSVGSVMAIAGQVGALTLLAGVPRWSRIVLALLVTALCGSINQRIGGRYGRNRSSQR